MDRLEFLLAFLECAGLVLVFFDGALGVVLAFLESAGLVLDFFDVVLAVFDVVLGVVLGVVFFALGFDAGAVLVGVLAFDCRLKQIDRE
jgi:hypothetical protein